GSARSISGGVWGRGAGVRGGLCYWFGLKNGIFLIVPFFHASSNMAQTPHFVRQTAPLGTERSMKKRGDKKYLHFFGTHQ
ncbi:MAG: hypothetical protein MR568_12535, partial [Eisenbergiella massiliensis]|uniref:hypothetical protein n=1 Tax=Eisenbergiella massiliensis TaxID=1720294 RepID=UPI0023F4CDF9